MLLEVAMEMVIPLLMAVIVDEGIENDALVGMDKIRYVAMMCAVYVIVSASRVLLWQAGFFKMQRALEGSLFNLRTKFFSHVQNIGLKFYQNTSAGELFNCILGSPMANIKAYMNSIFMSVPYQVVAFVISLSALVFYEAVEDKSSLLCTVGCCFFSHYYFVSCNNFFEIFSFRTSEKLL